MARSLLHGQMCTLDLVGEKELQLAIDVTHEPWTILAAKILATLKGELVEMGYEIEPLDEYIAFVRDVRGTLS